MERLATLAADAAPDRAVGMRLSELIGSLSHALDLTEGQPKGHCVRACWIGSHVGTAIDPLCFEALEQIVGAGATRR